MTDTRPCSCAPDERPYPCQHQYALGLCRKAEIRSLRAELDRCIAQIGDLAKLRSEEEVAHGHVMGRIAIALFGERNNRTDEECVKQAIDVVCERNRLRQHLHDEHQRHVVTMDERDALQADLAAALEHVKDYKENSELFLKLLQKTEADLAAARAERDLAQTSGVEHANYWQEQAKDYEENSALFLKERDYAMEMVNAQDNQIDALRALLKEIREQGYRKEMTARIDAALGDKP